MSRLRKRLAGAIFAAVVTCSASTADARCNFNAAGLTVTPVTASTGIYTPPTAPSAQGVGIRLQGTYRTTNATNPLCTIAISFNRTAPVSMARSGGGATLPYTIRSLPGGGNTLLFAGGGLPTATQILSFSFTQAGTNLTAQPFDITLTPYFLAQPGSPQREGSYSDGPTIRVYNVRQGSGALTQLVSRAFTITGTVAKACTIGGVASPTDDAATIPVNAMGVVNTAVITKSYLTVVCNALTNLQATSLSGGVKRAAAAPGGFSHIINYSAVATFGGATSTVNTATVATAVAAEAGSIGTTSSATSSGTLGVTITPQAPGQPLVSGSYSDVLRIELTPQ